MRVTCMPGCQVARLPGKPGNSATRKPSVVQFSCDDIQTPQRRDGIGNGLPDDHRRERLIDGEARRPAAHAIWILRAVGDDVEPELAVAALDLEVRLTDRRLDAVHDQL